MHNSPFYDMIYSLREKKKKSVSTDKQCIVMRFFLGGDWLIRCKLSDEVEEYLLCSSQSHKQGKATSKHTLYELPDTLTQLRWWPRCEEGQEMVGANLHKLCCLSSSGGIKGRRPRLSKSYAKVELNGKKICSGGSLVATPDCDTAVLGSNPAIAPAYSGLPVLRWAAIWDGTSL